MTSRSVEAEKTPLLVCAVLREDNVVTDIASGENGGKSLVARFPARQTRYNFIELDDNTPVIERFAFLIEPGWKSQNLRLAVFVQNKRTGAVYQAADIPWQSEPDAAKVGHVDCHDVEWSALGDRQKSRGTMPVSHNLITPGKPRTDRSLADSVFLGANR